MANELNTFEKVAEAGDLVEITTAKEERFTGLLSELFCVTKNDKGFSAEIAVTQRDKGEDAPFGTVLIALENIKEIRMIQKIK